MTPSKPETTGITASLLASNQLLDPDLGTPIESILTTPSDTEFVDEGHSPPVLDPTRFMQTASLGDDEFQWLEDEAEVAVQSSGRAFTGSGLNDAVGPDGPLFVTQPGIPDNGGKIGDPNEPLIVTQPGIPDKADNGGSQTEPEFNSLPYFPDEASSDESSNVLDFMAGPSASLNTDGLGLGFGNGAPHDTFSAAVIPDSFNLLGDSFDQPSNAIETLAIDALPAADQETMHMVSLNDYSTQLFDLDIIG